MVQESSILNSLQRLLIRYRSTKKFADVLVFIDLCDVHVWVKYEVLFDYTEVFE